MNDIIIEKVHKLYWDLDINCARTTLICLGELFNIEMYEQTIDSAIGLHGAGGYRAQCGLVEGALMFIGIYLSMQNRGTEEISEICYRFAEKFTNQFGSLSCIDLRPNGFTQNDPPHACEKLTADAISYIFQFMTNMD